MAPSRGLEPVCTDCDPPNSAFNGIILGGLQICQGKRQVLPVRASPPPESQLLHVR